MEPQMNADRLNGLSERVLKRSFTVANTHGCGFLEKVYENALAHELRKASLAVVQQRGIISSATTMWWSANTLLTCWSKSRSSWN